ncbi:hypothetical protein JCM3775_002551 [Rhodotorula graminis]
MSTAASSGQYPVKRFPLDQPLEWSARTTSSLMQDLVRRREVIFDKQREADDGTLQDRLDKLAITNLSKGHRADRAALASYKRFCTLADIPPYPLTYAVIALALFARCSAEDVFDRSLRSVLLRLKDETGHFWAAHSVYKELCEEDSQGDALDEFARGQAGKKKATNVARSVAGPSSAPRRPRPSYVGQDHLGPSSSSVGLRKRKLVEIVSSSEDDYMDEDDETDERVGEWPQQLPSTRSVREDGRASASSEAHQHVDLGYHRQPPPRRTSPRPPPPVSPAPDALHFAASTSPAALSSTLDDSNQDVVDFLRRLGPSLVPLAPYLAVAGLNSVEDLVALMNFEPTTLALLFSELRHVVHPVSKSRPSVIQLKLLHKRLEEERAGLQVVRR